MSLPLPLPLSPPPVARLRSNRAAALFVAASLLGATPLAACNGGGDDPNGTSVGNPGLLALRIAPPLQAEVTDLFLDPTELRLVPCDDGAEDDGEEQVLHDGEFVLGDEVELPAGSWCGLIGDIQGAVFVVVVLDDAAEDEFVLELPLDAIELNAPDDSGFVVAAEQPFVLELGSPGWFDGGDVDVVPGDDDDDDELDLDEEALELLAGVLADESGLYADGDGDGELSEAERDVGAVAGQSAGGAGDGDDDDSAGDGDGLPDSCAGCSANLGSGGSGGSGDGDGDGDRATSARGAASAAQLALLVGLGLSRRRRRPAGPRRSPRPCASRSP